MAFFLSRRRVLECLVPPSTRTKLDDLYPKIRIQQLSVLLILILYICSMPIATPSNQTNRKWKNFAVEVAEGELHPLLYMNVAL